jgi:hypothetical protein
MSGIRRAEIPMMNGSNTLNERLSGSFRQHDRLHSLLFAAGRLRCAMAAEGREAIDTPVASRRPAT